MSLVSRAPLTLSHVPKLGITGEGGLIDGTNPAIFTALDPLRLWIVQVGIIMVTSQLLYRCIRPLRQPKVIAELLGGILLGPTALGRIPGFTDRIFPSQSLPYLTLVADIGLCFFLFLIGLEIDINLVKRNARNSAIVSLAGIAVPFGLGSMLSIVLYHHFISPSVPFAYFMLFTSVAYSITAFPVLCRILTELKLLNTDVGVVVLSAGIGNDIVGWILLALNVAIVKSGSGLSALWILVVCAAFTVFLLFPIRFLMLWLARKTDSTEKGPTRFYMTVVMILVWTCAFFTDSIGVNTFFGAFLSGLVIPREGGLAVTLAEKMEDIVFIIFLPLYFALSGLKTNLGMLDNGKTWVFTIAIIVLSFCGKLGGCMMASRTMGHGWHESSVIGVLMSCKGLIEIIVLNVGLEAGILPQRVFSMFVLEALVLTFVTMPLVSVIYSRGHCVRVGDTARPVQEDGRGRLRFNIDETLPWRHRFTIILDKLDHLPCAMAFTRLVIPPRHMSSNNASTKTTVESTNESKVPVVSVDALKLVELSDRTSTMMKSFMDVNDFMQVEPVLGIFKTFGELNGLDVTTSLSVVPYDDFARSVIEHAQSHASHMILFPWPVPHTASTGLDMHGTGEDGSISKGSKNDRSPFDIFGSHGKADNFSPTIDSPFVRGVFDLQSNTDVALFVDTGDQSGCHTGGGSLHVFLPFFGGPDDRLALEFVAQLCLNPKVTATVVRMARHDAVTGSGSGRPSAGTKDESGLPPKEPTAHAEEPSVTSTMKSNSIQSQPTRLQTEMADCITWNKYATPLSDGNANSDATFSIRLALSRIQFSDMRTSTPVRATIMHAHETKETHPRLLIVSGRSRRHAKESHAVEMKWLLDTYHPSGAAVEGMRQTIGDVSTAVVVDGSASGVVVVQAARVGE